MAGLAEFRQQHPEYNDMGDVELADALHEKFYADVPKHEYDAHLGIKTSQGLGFQEGVTGVVKNIAPAFDPLKSGMTPLNLIGGLALEHGADASKKYIEGQEAHGVRPGQVGKTVGGMVASAPFSAAGGPLLAGAMQGFAASDAEDMNGKLLSAGLGAIGGKAASGLIHKVAEIAAPVIDPAVRRLVGQGVKLTPGQIRGGSAMVAEDKKISLPIVGDAITAARQQSRVDANRALVNKVLEPLKAKLPAAVAAGHDAIDYAHKAVSDAYDAVVPHMAVQLDPRSVVGLRKLFNAATALPEQQQAQFQAVLKGVRFGPNGSLAGKPLQNALSEVRRLSGVYRTSAVASERELGQLLGGLREELGNLAMRQNPTHAPALNEANAAFRRLAIAESAAKGADEGIASPGQIKTAVRQADPSRRKADTARGKAVLQDFAEDVKKVIPARTPDSGTAGRLQRGIVSNIRGGSALLGHNLDAAIMEALAKAPPQVQQTVRGALLGLERPGGLLGALSLSHQTEK